MSKYIIYALHDPTTDQIRYVGRSSEGIQRAKKHLMPSHYANDRMKHFPIYCWVRKVIASGSLPRISILAQTDSPDNLNSLEVTHIKTLGLENLLNVTSGGDGSSGHKVSTVTRQKLRNANLGKKQTPETIAKKKATMMQKTLYNQRSIEDSNGKVYSSISQAARELGIHKSLIHYAIVGNKTTHNLKFRYKDGN